MRLTLLTLYMALCAIECRAQETSKTSDDDNTGSLPNETTISVWGQIWTYLGPLLYAGFLISLLGGPIMERIRLWWQPQLSPEESSERDPSSEESLRKAEEEIRMRQQGRINEVQERKRRLREQREASSLGDSGSGSASGIGVTVHHRGNYSEEAGDIGRSPEVTETIKQQNDAYSKSLQKVSGKL